MRQGAPTSRTGAPDRAIFAEWLLLASCPWAAAWDAALSLGMGAALGYAVAVFVGVRASHEDLLDG